MKVHKDITLTALVIAQIHAIRAQVDRNVRREVLHIEALSNVAVVKHPALCIVAEEEQYRDFCSLLLNEFVKGATEDRLLDMCEKQLDHLKRSR